MLNRWHQLHDGNGDSDVLYSYGLCSYGLNSHGLSTAMSWHRRQADPMAPGTLDRARSASHVGKRARLRLFLNHLDVNFPTAAAVHWDQPISRPHMYTLMVHVVMAYVVMA